MLERHLLVRRLGLTRDEIVERQGPGRQRPAGIGVPDDDRAPDGRELLAQFRHAGQPVDLFAPAK